MSQPQLDAPIPRRPSAAVVLDDASIGRIEEWVVHTLGEAAGPSPVADWRDSLADFSLAKRPEAPRSVASTADPAPSEGPWARFRLSRRRGVAVVSLTDQALMRDEDLAELAGDLLAVVEAGHLRVVLDFFAVERLSSWAARAINQAARDCSRTSGATLKFSGLRPDVAAIFAMTGLDPGVATYPDTSSAVAAPWPELPGLRPLPVPILAALMRAEGPRPTRPTPLRPGSSGRLAEDQIAMNGARLVVQDGPLAGKTVAIAGDRLVIGRGAGCQLRIGSSMVSRSHARIERRGGRFFLRDLASTNGSRLNGRAVRDAIVEIRDGDRIQVGPLTLALAVGGNPSRFEARPAVDDRGWAGDDEPSGSTAEFGDLDERLGDAGIKHEVVEGVLVVTPTVPELDEPEAVDAFRDALVALATARRPRRVVVNLTHVGHLSGRAIGVLVAHHLRLDRSGGSLRVCLANPRVALVLEQVKLGMFIDYHANVDDAVLAAWPEPAGVASRS